MSCKSLGLAASLLLLLTAPAHSQGLNWYRGNTHAHTINSDGDTAPDGVVRWYREHGYHFLFVTDHEFITDVGPLNALFGAAGRFLVLPGQEITQWGADPSRASAHVNGLFMSRVVLPVGEHRCMGPACGAFSPASMSLADTFRTNIAGVRAQQGIAQVNHPNFRWSVRPGDLNDVPDGTLIEIWNGLDGINNLGGDNGVGDVRPSAEGYWDHLLSLGRIVWGVGSDDSHTAEGRGQAWIVVRAAELTAAALRSAIEQGQFYASNGVTLTDIAVTDTEFAVTIEQARLGPPRYMTRFIGQNGRVLAEVAGLTPRYRFQGNETYVRAAVTDSNGRRAWTQPVFRDRRARGRAS